MREKMGALIQFLAIIAACVLLIWGIGGAYLEYFGAEIPKASIVSLRLIAAAIGAGFGIVGVVVGNLLKR